MSVLKRTIRGIRDTIPSGYILGRQSSGNGPAELIPLTGLGQSLVASGFVGGPSGSVPLGTPIHLFNSTGSFGNTNDNNEDTLITYTLPAGTLKTIGDRLHIKWRYQSPNTATSRDFRLYFGTLIGLGNIALTVANWVAESDWEIVKTAANAQSVFYRTIATTSQTTYQNTPETVVVNGTTTQIDTNPIIIKITGQIVGTAAANLCIANMLDVEYWPSPT